MSSWDLNEFSNMLERAGQEPREKRKAGKKVIEAVEAEEPFSEKVLEVMNLVDRWNQIRMTATETFGINPEDSEMLEKGLIELRKKINSLVG